MAPADADDATLLRLTSEALGASGSVVLLVRGVDGGLSVIGPAEGTPNEAGVAAIQHVAAQASTASDDGALLGSFAAIGLAAVAAPAADGDGSDTVLLWPAGADGAQPADEDTATVAVALLGAARARRVSRSREAELRGYLEENARTGRELAHRLNNDLTMPVGVVELLLDRTGFAPDLHDMLQAAANDLASLERHIRGFHTLMRTQSGALAADE